MHLMEPASFPASAGKASRRLAVLMIAATIAVASFKHPLPLAVAGVAGLAALWFGLRQFGRAGSWLPNVITYARVLLTAGLLLKGATLSGPWIALAVFSLFVMDGLDGVVARRLNQTSQLGAHLDMESDVFLVLTVCQVHIMRGMPAWVLIGGLLRYGYVLLLQLANARGEAPRSQFGRYVFATWTNSAALAFLPMGAASTWLLRLATAILCYSFARSLYWSLLPAKVDQRT